MKNSIESWHAFTPFYQSCSSLFVCVMLTVITRPVYAIDILPGNGVPPPVGFQAIQTAYQTNELYIPSSATSINNDAITLRYIKGMQPLGKPAAFFIQPSYVRSTLSNKNITRTVEGIGDTTLAFAFWPYVSNEKRRFWGLAGYIFAPTGEYDSNRPVNPGTNRWSYAFQSGYQFGLYQKIDLMLATDIQLFCDNKDSPIQKKSLSQDELYSYQATLMSPVTDRFKMAVSLFVHRGGAVEVDGIPRSDAVQRERYEITSSYISRFGAFHFQYGADINKEHTSAPLEKNRFVFRYQKAF